MRRRFEKRVYIALPEPSARANMFKLNLGDTPNDLNDEDFRHLGLQTDGYSGSDIAVVVREALMEPLRKCQVAKQFLSDAQGNLHPCEDYPNCPYCPLNLSDELASMNPQYKREVVCSHCKAVRMSLYDVPTEKLVVPRICVRDFDKALTRAHSSVGADELQRFVKWTEEFGQDG